MPHGGRSKPREALDDDKIKLENEAIGDGSSTPNRKSYTSGTLLKMTVTLTYDLGMQTRPRLFSNLRNYQTESKSLSAVVFNLSCRRARAHLYQITHNITHVFMTTV